MNLHFILHIILSNGLPRIVNKFVSYVWLQSSAFCKFLVYDYDCIQRRQSGLKSGGVVDPGEKIPIFHSIFSGDFTKKQIFRANFRKISGQIPEKFRFFTANFTKIFNFSNQISEEFQFFRKFLKNFPFSKKNLRKISTFSGNFTKNFNFLKQISEEFRFFRQSHKKIQFFRLFHKNSIIQEQFPKNFDFFR